MARKIAFVNPFGTSIYDEIINETLLPYAASDTKVHVSHLTGAPANIDYYWPKHLMEVAIFERVMQLAEQDYSAIIIGCCYDPGVDVARELVDIPVVGPLEAAINMARYFGHRFSVVTDHHKAVPYLEDMVRLYGAESRCRGVRCIDWWVPQMVERTQEVADKAAAVCRLALEEDHAEVVILGCTIIGGCLERDNMQRGVYSDLPVINPNLMALKSAESLADLYSLGKYNISRRGFYQKLAQHDAPEFAEVRRRFRLVDRGESDDR